MVRIVQKVLQSHIRPDGGAVSLAGLPFFLAELWGFTSCRIHDFLIYLPDDYMIRCWIRLQPSNQSRSLGRQRVEGSLGDVLKPELPWEAQPLVKMSVSVGGHVSQSAGFPLEGCHCKFGYMLKKNISSCFIFQPQETTAGPTAFCCCLSSFVCGKLHRDTVGNHH